MASFKLKSTKIVKENDVNFEHITGQLNGPLFINTLEELMEHFIYWEKYRYGTFGIVPQVPQLNHYIWLIYPPQPKWH